MTKRIYIILTLGAVLLTGCATYLPEQDVAFLINKAPLVSCNKLTQDGKTTEWNGQPFTGRTVRYKWGFELVLYQDGKRIPDDKLIPYWMPTWMPDEEKQPEYYRAAFREYARSDWGFAHDDYVRIIKYGYGNIEDVPKLIKGLESYGDLEPGKPVVCSRDHCLNALKAVTGANPGPNATDWQKWWDNYQKKEK